MDNLIHANRLATLLDITYFQYSKPSQAQKHQQELSFMEMAHAWRHWIFDDYPSSYAKIHEEKFSTIVVE